MTMPDERMRSIVWGGELLARIATDMSLPKTIITAAQRIAQNYPSAHALKERLMSEVVGLPPEWAAGLLDALGLFEEMYESEHGSTGMRSQLRSTLRHFPDRMTVRVMLRASPLSAWLQTDTRR
jgi:hypothetical protein